MNAATPIMRHERVFLLDSVLACFADVSLFKAYLANRAIRQVTLVLDDGAGTTWNVLINLRREATDT